MGLSCSCWEGGEPGDVLWYEPDDYTTLTTKTRRRCASCKQPIDVGGVVLQFSRFKIPDHDVEIAIYGDDGEIPRAPAYLCEGCGDMWNNFDALGYCVAPYDDMGELLAEYVADHAPTSKPGNVTDD